MNSDSLPVNRANRALDSLASYEFDAYSLAITPNHLAQRPFGRGFTLIELQDGQVV